LPSDSGSNAVKCESHIFLQTSISLIAAAEG